MDYPKYFNLWAKTDKLGGNAQIHPLIYHMLDVGECTLALWENALSEQTKRIFSRWVGGLDTDVTGRLLAFWASLHDLGKAAPGFQQKYQSCIHFLEAEGFIFPKDVSPTPAPHGILSTWALKENLFVEETGLTPRDAKLIAFALGGHHGAWPTTDRIQSPALQKSDKGVGLWDIARKDLLLTLKAVYQPVKTASLPKEQDEVNAFLILFSGLVSVADWIGSMEENFPFREDYLPAGKYVNDYARKQARDALKRLGWLGWQADGSLLTFAAMFPDIQINAIQQKTIENAVGCKLPALVILEAPTGIGKTEAALFLADAWMQTQKGKGIYIAMPTQATSNQMFERTTNFLVNRYPLQSIKTYLVHGAALLKDDEETPQMQGIAEDEKFAEGNVKAETWFLPRKRTLLAPFGIGTVDQALMSVLQTNHFFVRMFGLGQKVVIFDEVHAYDTYMSTLFQRLLRWLRSIGTSVILLSATLPEKTRQELVGAWLGDEEITLTPAAYPRLTVVGSEKPEVIELPSPESHTLQLAWVDPAPEQIADHLAEKLMDGGCATVICNRVKRAQEIYEALKAKGIVENDNLILFHARFPFAWRKEIEVRVLSIFGKDKDHPDQPNPNRPQKAIVVATQVIEQSLDLDFDYMLTDLAPIDLMLQRAGRLHRHKQNENNRPMAIKTPCLTVARLPEVEGLPNFGDDIWIYDEATLLCTWLILQKVTQLILPVQTTELIESVYGNVLEEKILSEIFVKKLEKSKREMVKDQEKAKLIARNHLVPAPEFRLIDADNLQLDDEENPSIHEAFRALTRLADAGISLICLHRIGQEVALEPTGKGSGINLDKRPSLDDAKSFLRRAVNVQNHNAVNYFSEKMKSLPSEWKKSANVRYHYPIVFENGKWDEKDAPFTMELSPEFGLKIFKKEAK